MITSNNVSKINISNKLNHLFNQQKQLIEQLKALKFKYLFFKNSVNKAR